MIKFDQKYFHLINCVRHSYISRAPQKALVVSFILGGLRGTSATRGTLGEMRHFLLYITMLLLTIINFLPVVAQNSIDDIIDTSGDLLSKSYTCDTLFGFKINFTDYNVSNKIISQSFIIGHHDDTINTTYSISIADDSLLKLHDTLLISLYQYWELQDIDTSRKPIDFDGIYQLDSNNYIIVNNFWKNNELVYLLWHNYKLIKLTILKNDKYNPYLLEEIINNHIMFKHNQSYTNLNSDNKVLPSVFMKKYICHKYLGNVSSEALIDYSSEETFLQFYGTYTYTIIHFNDFDTIYYHIKFLPNGILEPKLNLIYRDKDDSNERNNFVMKMKKDRYRLFNNYINYSNANDGFEIIKNKIIWGKFNYYGQIFTNKIDMLVKDIKSGLYEHRQYIIKEEVKK